MLRGRLDFGPPARLLRTPKPERPDAPTLGFYRPCCRGPHMPCWGNQSGLMGGGWELWNLLVLEPYMMLEMALLTPPSVRGLFREYVH